MIDRDELRAHLQFHLVGHIHWHFIEAACEAISKVVDGAEGEPVLTPPRHLLTMEDLIDVPMGALVSAAELVEGWNLEKFVELARDSRASAPATDGT